MNENQTDDKIAANHQDQIHSSVEKGNSASEHYSP
jgi:hypothetical protein